MKIIYSNLTIVNIIEVKCMLPSCFAVNSNFRKQEHRLTEQHAQQILLATGIVLQIDSKDYNERYNRETQPHFELDLFSDKNHCV